MTEKNIENNNDHPKYKLESIKRLNKYHNNSRKHSKEQIDQIKKSIKEFGFTNPIIIDENNMILAGHARFSAAKKLNMKEVPCLMLSGLSDVQKRAYVIADNKLALNADWDIDLLALEVEAIMSDDFDVDILGFSADEINLMFDDGEFIAAKEASEKSYSEVYEVIVECDSERDQKILYDRLVSEGRKCRVLSM